MDKQEALDILSRCRKLAEHLATSQGVLTKLDANELSLLNDFNRVLEAFDDYEFQGLAP